MYHLLQQITNTWKQIKLCIIYVPYKRLVLRYNYITKALYNVKSLKFCKCCATTRRYTANV